ncbi:MAG: T9SS type A sorting domain-containing protein [Flavobacteriaceae bacterium]|nr:T9SS type A sorting domain-containing protein [Flavobacteriaceae bacterium]MDG2315271.1 T9SS type A sorting domain-containing protein [Flavobacteriaceae bacterium]
MKNFYVLLFIMSGVFLLAQPTSQPPAPTHAEAKVVSVFSDTYTEVVGTYNFDPFWGQGTDCTTESIGGGEVVKMAGLNFQGIEYPAQDVSHRDYFHVDYYIEGTSTTSLEIYVIKAGGTEVSKALSVATTDSWVSLDILLTDYAGVDLTAVNQLKIVGNGTVYFDNFYFHGTDDVPTPASGTPPTGYATAPTTPSADVISVFSDAYTEVAGTYNFDPDWGQSTDCTVTTIGGGSEEVIKMAGLSYQGINYPAQDVSSKGELHVDYYIESANIAELKIFLINEGAGQEVAKSLDVSTTGSWVSVNIPLADFSGVDLTAVNQFKITGSGTVYFDNIYFLGDAPTPITGETLDFTDATEADKFTASNTNFLFEHVATGGNTGGAIKAGTELGAGASDWRLYYTNSNIDFTNAAKLVVSFDLKQFSSTAVGLGLHFRISTSANTATEQGDYTGAIQNAGAYNGNTALNNSSWTSYEFESAVSASSSLASFGFNFSTGADATHEGVILIDNVEIKLLDSSGNTLSIKKIEIPQFVTYPNPVQNELHVKGSTSVESIVIYDIMGRNVLSRLPNKSEFNLNVSHLKKGVYMIKIKSGDNVITKKLVK